MRARVLVSTDTNPHRNLAREEALLLRYDVGCEEPILYLWQNAATVVIGRNQNAWRECRADLLRQEGGTLARRTTGGGAVFHDLGNLNFSFLLPRAQYDLTRQLNVVREAVAAFGIDCAFSGRNDLLAEGRKFSGNAFRFTAQGALHHGTLMVRVDPEKMGRYLQVSPAKLAARGVKSVASRVVNLADLGTVTIDAMREAMGRAFAAAYGAATPEDADALDIPGSAALAERNATWDWNYGAAPSFDIALEHRFDWGGVELHLNVQSGRVAQCAVYTDAMDADLADALQAALLNCPLRPDALAERVGGEVGAWLSQAEL
ncbi:MAG: lipoate--protein ligase [Oscillospiraceae bacterium]|jgi:lipoate-protein ligase A|nr:lipoate--protein ligase [Oscillospiraceae bacterium]